MPSVNYVLIYCTSCREIRKISPERVYELRKMGELEWTQTRALECPIPTCKGSMKRAPEYGEPMLMAQGFWPMSSDVEWMS
jgi:hypothetical protein